MKLRFITGGIIALHGLLRIIFIDKYVLFVHDNFESMLGVDTILTIGAALFPFIEFLVGLMIALRLGSKKALCGGMAISVIMSGFIVLGDLYPRLIYHFVVLSLLSAICIQQQHRQRKKLIL